MQTNLSCRLQRLFHALIADYPGLLLVVLDVIVLLSILETSPHIQLALILAHHLHPLLLGNNNNLGLPGFQTIPGCGPLLLVTFLSALALADESVRIAA